jgi:hypothetical protein
LLVVSGTIDPSLSGAPTALDDLIRAALAEIEGSPAIEISDICEIGVAASVALDLRLLLAELMENATNFSPPGTSVTVTARLIRRQRGGAVPSDRGGADGEAADCEIRIIDHGVGLSAAKMAEENRRLVERERLDVTPTSVLGLFVVGRLARRHGLSVGLAPSPERGVTAAVVLPAKLFTVGAVPAAKARSGRRPRMARTERVQLIEVPEPYGSFAWFTRFAEAGAGELVPGEFLPDGLASGLVVATMAGSRARVASVTTSPAPVWGDPGPERPVRAPDPRTPLAPRLSPPAPAASSLPPAEPPSEPPPELTPRHQPAPPERSPLAPPVLPRPVGPTSLPRRGTGEGVARGGGANPLARRVPGTHLAAITGDAALADTSRSEGVRAPRDPEAERAALNDFMSGLSRGSDPQTGSNPRAESTSIDSTIAEGH